jgi:hypothetical protein
MKFNKKNLSIFIISFLLIQKTATLQAIDVGSKNLDKALVLSLTAAGLSYAFYRITRTLFESYALSVKHKIELERQNSQNRTEF